MVRHTVVGIRDADPRITAEAQLASVLERVHASDVSSVREHQEVEHQPGVLLIRVRDAQRLGHVDR